MQIETKFSFRYIVHTDSGVYQLPNVNLILVPRDKAAAA